jgi:hypothetical protein
METPTISLTNGRAAINRLTKLENQKPHLPAHLTQGEEQEFFQEELIVRNGLANIWEMGRALKRIRDMRYYRKYYPTFEEYLKKRWDLGPAYCSRLIDSADMITLLGSHVTETDLPANEWQARQLLGLEPEKAALVWRQVLEKADGGLVTAALVKEVVLKLVPREPKQKAGRPRWGSLVKAAKASLDHLAAAEEAVKDGKNLEAGLNSLAKLRPLLELLAKQQGARRRSATPER